INIRPEVRWHYKIYHRWIAEYCEEAARIKWEFSGMKIGPSYLLWHRIRRVRERITQWVKGPSLGYSMVPFEYWFTKNVDLANDLERYVNENSEKLADAPDVYKDAVRLFRTGTVLEKTQIVTLLAAMDVLGL